MASEDFGFDAEEFEKNATMTAERTQPQSALVDDDEDEDDNLKSVVITDVQAVSNREQREIRLERSGWMTKQGGGSKTTFSRKNWKERWFVLKAGVLSYAKTVAAPPLGEIQIKSIIDVSATDGTDTNVREFSIVTEGRTYYFRCHTHEDCLAWIASLRKVRADVTGTMGTGSVETTSMLF